MLLTRRIRGYSPAQLLYFSDINFSNLNSPQFLQSSCYSRFIFQCSIVCSMFVVRFFLLAMVLSVFRLNDFCLPLWYLRIPFIEICCICYNFKTLKIRNGLEKYCTKQMSLPSDLASQFDLFGFEFSFAMFESFLLCFGSNVTDERLPLGMYILHILIVHIYSTSVILCIKV